MSSAFTERITCVAFAGLLSQFNCSGIPVWDDLPRDDENQVNFFNFLWHQGRKNKRAGLTKSYQGPMRKGQFSIGPFLCAMEAAAYLTQFLSSLLLFRTYRPELADLDPSNVDDEWMES